jgi:ribosomal protein S18 acetylase RimI-like enzyme
VLDYSALDNPVWASLTGPLARHGTVRGEAARFDPGVSLFTAIAGDTGWADLATLLGPDTEALISGPYLRPPPGWAPLVRYDGVQLVGSGVRGEPDPEAVALTVADTAEVLDLVARTKPGPFRDRTLELGGYLGVRDGGKLIAMAGQRLRVPGFTEVSAVCTDPAYRGRGLAARLSLAVAADIQARGDTPFLAALATNTSAVRLYERLGFKVRGDVVFASVRTPAG